MAVDEVPRSALIIDSPHIEYILAGEKTWEMRSRNCTKREPIELIRKGSGKVVGLARVIDVRGPLTRSDILANLDKHRGSREEIDKPTLAKYNFAWIISDARALAQPVSYEHKGGVTWVTLDNDVREKIANQTGLRFVRGIPVHRRIKAQEQRQTRRKSTVARKKRKGEASGSGGCVIATILTIGGIVIIANVGLVPSLVGLVALGLLTSGGSFLSIIRVLPILLILVFILKLLGSLL